MKLKGFKSDKLMWVKIQPYIVEWSGKSPSKFQQEVKKFIEPYWNKDIVCEEFRIPQSLLRIDLINFNKKIVVEASGNQHNSYSEHFHGGNRYAWVSQMKRDLAKEEWCERNEFKFVEIFPNDLPLTRKFFKEKFDIDLV